MNTKIAGAIAGAFIAGSALTTAVGQLKAGVWNAGNFFKDSRGVLYVHVTGANGKPCLDTTLPAESCLHKCIDDTVANTKAECE